MAARARPTLDLEPAIDVPRTIPWTARVAGPPIFDLGRLQRGEATTRSLPIVNLAPAPATISVRYDGSPRISLRASPTHLDAGDHRPIVLAFVAPTPCGPHRGTVRIDLRWSARLVETVTIPVLAHAGHPVATDDLPFRSRHARDAVRTRQLARAEAEVATLDRAIVHPRFEAQLAAVSDAMALVGAQQQLGIDRAARELDHAKALPTSAPWLDLSMIALDLASARVGDLIATSIEAGLRDLATAADPSKPMALADSTIAAIAHATRRGLAVGSWRRTNRRPATSDPRRAFVELIRIGNTLHERERQVGVRHAAALLRPLLHARSALAVGALRVIEHALRAEAGHASVAYFEATLRQWLTSAS